MIKKTKNLTDRPDIKVLPCDRCRECDNLYMTSCPGGHCVECVGCDPLTVVTGCSDGPYRLCGIIPMSQVCGDPGSNFYLYIDIVSAMS